MTSERERWFSENEERDYFEARVKRVAQLGSD